MKKALFLTIFGLLVLFQSTSTTQAAVFTFNPTPSDLNDLDHYYAYSWGIRQALGPNEVITSARLGFKNINNWAIEDTDRLYVRLFNNTPEGVRRFNDNQAVGDYFSDRGIRLFTFRDNNEYQNTNGSWVNPSENFVYNFSSTELNRLNLNIQDGNFGFGFDPDCHYFNDGITFRFRTETATPEPASMTLLGLGLLGIWRFGKKRE